MEREQGGQSASRRRAATALAITIALTGSVDLLNIDPALARTQTPPAATEEVLGVAPVDLLGPGTHWQLAGVTQSTHQLEVSNTNLSIVHQDGSLGLLDPPVNLYGTRLDERGGFTVNVSLSNVASASQISFYDKPPLVEDEFLAETSTLNMEVNGKVFSASITDRRGKVASQLSQAIMPALSHNISVNDNAGRLSFNVDSQSVSQRLPDHGIFKPGQVWFGFDALTNGGSFTVSQLTASGHHGSVGIADTRSTQITQNPNGFAALAQKKRPGFYVGAAVAPGPMVSDLAYDSLLGNDNAVSVENVGKWQTIHPLEGNSPGDYNFSDMDAVVAMAQKAGMRVHGHALIFGEANPAWLQNLAKTHPEQMQQIMVDDITTVMKHYAGKVASWDVLDEPLADYDTTPGQYGLRKDIWYNAIGPGYIATALKAAHAADPAAELWINDFGMESDDTRFAQMINLIELLKSEGAPLTGIGFESHIDSGDTIRSDTHIDVAKLRSRFQALRSLGLLARVSELDVSSPREYPVFGDAITACIDEPNCEGVTTWGITNKYSSGGELNAKGRFVPGIGLPFDKNEQPTAAIGYIEKAL